MSISRTTHLLDGRKCRVLGREYTSEAPYVVIRFVDENGADMADERRVKPWELEPKLPIYPRS
jgi:hypothetical protein